MYHHFNSAAVSKTVADLILVRRMFRPCVKVILIAVSFAAPLWPAQGDEPSYQADVHATLGRYLALENRKQTGRTLPPAEEEERRCLLGRLIDQDPLWALNRELTAEALALQQATVKPQEQAQIQKLFEFVQITMEFEHRATTLAEAKSFAQLLRQFIARQDLEGAKAWLKAQ